MSRAARTAALARHPALNRMPRDFLAAGLPPHRRLRDTSRKDR
jgi:hypothetical protein